MATALKSSFLDAIFSRLSSSEPVGGAAASRCPFARFFKAKAGPAPQSRGEC